MEITLPHNKTENRLEYLKNWRNINKIKIAEQTKKWRLENSERKKELNRNWIINNRERYNASKYRYRDRVKIEVLKHYAKDGILECAFCGFKNVDALCLDHINNDGSKHRKMLRISGTNGIPGYRTYEAMKMSNFPSGMQVLCANCNLIKEIQRSRNKRLLNKFYKNSCQN